MHIPMTFRKPLWWRKACTPFLALFLLSGLLAGFFAGISAGNFSLLMMRSAASSTVSISGLLGVIFLPLLISAFAVYFDFTWLLLPLSFLKAFLFAFNSYLVTAAFGSAGWLVRLLLLFSDSLVLPVLCWFWLRHLPEKKDTFFRDLVVCAALAFVVGVIDYGVISPNLAMLIEI